RRLSVRRRHHAQLDLPLPGRERPASRAVPPRLPWGAVVPPRAELPLHRHHPGSRQRAHRAQRQPPRQEAVDGRCAWRADPPLHRLQRAGRGGVRDPPHPRARLARGLEALRGRARADGSSLWEAAAASLAAGGALGAKAGGAIHGFMALIERLAAERGALALHEQVDQLLKASGLIEHYRRDKAERGETRVENLEELVSAARGFTPEGSELPPLEAFLAHAALESGEGQADEWEDCVQMMTLHSAKGLEFPVVFLAGMEEGLFPHQRSLTDLDGLEEERRLAYVGMTRAMRQLYLTCAEQRRL